MKASRLAIAALSLAAVAAYADDADLSGQFANTVAGSLTRAQVQAQLAEYRQAGVNPWSTTYNPLKSFKSERSRAEVQAEYIRSRDAVNAMTAEDSGSAYLAAHKPATHASRQLAGQPVNAQ
jgi:opacity protein-like surface antigen